MVNETIKYEAEENFNNNTKAYTGYGELEILHERIDKLEKTIAHLIGFMALHIPGLKEEDINEAGGLLDW